jgi:hypothetical protein
MDLFTSDFEHCRQQLKITSPLEASIDPRDRELGGNLNASLVKLRSDSERRLRDTKFRKQNTMKLVNLTQRAHELTKNALQSERERLLTLCEVHQGILVHQLEQYRQFADRRLRELLFE